MRPVPLKRRISDAEIEWRCWDFLERLLRAAEKQAEDNQARATGVAVGQAN